MFPKNVETVASTNMRSSQSPRPGRQLPAAPTTGTPLTFRESHRPPIPGRVVGGMIVWTGVDVVGLSWSHGPHGTGRRRRYDLRQHYDMLLRRLAVGQLRTRRWLELFARPGFSRLKPSDWFYCFGRVIHSEWVLQGGCRWGDDVAISTRLNASVHTDNTCPDCTPVIIVALDTEVRRCDEGW